MKIFHLIVVLILTFSSVNSFAESKQDPLWEKKINATIKWQKERALLLISKSPSSKELIEIQRDLQLAQNEIQTALYYYFLENEANRIERLRDQYYSFSWSAEDEEKLIEFNSRYKQLIDRKNKLKERNKGHPMWPELKEAYVEVKNDLEYQKLYKQLLNTLKEIDKSLGPAQKTSFTEDEYGVLHWESKKDWKYNWQFKAKINFKSIEIILIDQEGKQNMLIDNETMNHVPFWFSFRLNEPELTGSMTNPTLAISFGYSRIGYKPMGASNWSYLQGKRFVDASYNNDPSFDESGRMLIAKVKTADDIREFEYTILLKFEEDK